MFVFHFISPFFSEFSGFSVNNTPAVSKFTQLSSELSRIQGEKLILAFFITEGTMAMNIIP